MHSSTAWGTSITSNQEFHLQESSWDHALPARLSARRCSDCGPTGLLTLASRPPKAWNRGSSADARHLSANHQVSNALDSNFWQFCFFFPLSLFHSTSVIDTYYPCYWFLTIHTCSGWELLSLLNQLFTNWNYLQFFILLLMWREKSLFQY